MKSTWNLCLAYPIFPLNSQNEIVTIHGNAYVSNKWKKHTHCKWIINHFVILFLMCLMISYFHTFLPIQWNTLKKSSNKKHLVWISFSFALAILKGSSKCMKCFGRRMNVSSVSWELVHLFACFYRSTPAHRSNSKDTPKIEWHKWIRIQNCYQCQFKFGLVFFFIFLSIQMSMAVTKLLSNSH